MLALLKLIPLRDWLYIGLITALISAFGLYTVHERHIGRAAVEAADAKLSAVQAKHDALVESTALETVNVTAQKYHDVTAAPVANPQHVIVRYAPAGNCVPQAPAASGSSDAAPVVSGQGAIDIGAASGKDVVSYDIGPPLDQLGRDADAQVEALQAIIRAYQEETK